MRSMTGYGMGEARKEDIRAQVEVRSVNARFAEIRLRLPAEMAPWELELRRKVSERVRRGKVDVSISLETEEVPRLRLKLNRTVAQEYLRAAEELRLEFDLTGTVGLPQLLALPGIMELERNEQAGSERALETVQEALEAALIAHDQARQREGEQLAADLMRHAVEIAQLVQAIDGRSSFATGTVRDRISERVQRLAPDVALDPGRLEQEIAFLADRADISEELVRLAAHLEAGRSVLFAGGEPAGKKLEFLLQEIGRETNTIGSKSADLEISRCVLAIKSEVEKMREQVQNVE